MTDIDTAFDPDTAAPGTVVHHTSDGEGGPPDVAYQVILSKGESLWVGEITRDRYEDAGGPEMGLGGDGGWWIIHYKGKDTAVLGKVADGTAAEDLTALIASQAARIRELEEGLEPFAKAGGVKLCGEWRDDERFGHTDVTFYLTFGDLRRARSLLNRTGEG